MPRAGASGGRGGGAARVQGAASIPDRKQSNLGVSRSGDGGRMRSQQRATAPHGPYIGAGPHAHQGSGSPLPGQAGSWNLSPAGGAQGGSLSPGRGTTLVDGTWSSPAWPQVTLPRVSPPVLRDAPFIAHSSAPSRPRITAPPLFGARELGWGGDPWGLEGVQEGAGYLGTLPFSPPTPGFISSDPLPPHYIINSSA